MCRPAHGMVTRPVEQSLPQRPSLAAVQGEHNSSAHAHTADAHMRDAAVADRRVAEVSALAEQGSRPPQQAQHTQQAKAQTSAPMSLPPSMIRIAAALPPVQQQVMVHLLRPPSACLSHISSWISLSVYSCTRFNRHNMLSKLLCKYGEPMSLLPSIRRIAPILPLVGSLCDVAQCALFINAAPV